MLTVQEWTLILNVASIASSIAVVVTLIFLKTQTQCAVDASRSQNHSILREEMLKIDEVFIQYPEIRKYFYEGVSIDTSDALYPRAEAAAEMLLDITEHMLGQAILFPRLHQKSNDEKKFWQTWDTYIVDMFVTSPLLLAYLQKKHQWYSFQMRKRMEEAQHRILMREKAGSN